MTDHSALIDAIPTDLWIGGKQVPSSSGARFPVHNPANGAVLTTVADASTADGATALDEAVACLLYTSDAADDMQCVDLGGRRIIKKRLCWATWWARQVDPERSVVVAVFSSRRRHTRCREVSWARRCV